MNCHPMFLFVYFSLLLMTAGFVLTLCSWLAPPLNEVVYGVRIFGLVGLLVGSLMLLSSCVVGGLNHGRCFSFCYIFGDNKHKRKRDSLSNYTAGVIENPLVMTANNTKTPRHNHVSHSTPAVYPALQNHMDQEKLSLGDKVNYGSCRSSVECSRIVGVYGNQSPVREAILVLSNDTTLGDNGNREYQSCGSHVSVDPSDTEKPTSNSSNPSSVNSGKIRILKAYHRGQLSDHDIGDPGKVADSYRDSIDVDRDNGLEKPKEHGHPQSVKINPTCGFRNSTEEMDDLVQMFMSG